MSKQRKITLDEFEIPTHWYNIAADMPNAPLPPLNPATNEPIGPDALAPLFPMALIEQEVSTAPPVASKAFKGVCSAPELPGAEEQNTPMEAR